MMRSFRENYTTLDIRKRRSGRRVTVRTDENIRAVRRFIYGAALRKPGEPEPSARRQNENISKSSYFRIFKNGIMSYFVSTGVNSCK